MQQQVEKLDGQARDALKANREDLAREALTRKAAIQGQLESIMQQGQQLEAQQQKLIEGQKTLSAKVESFRTQKEVIKAQYSAAEAQVRIGEAASGIGEHMADVGMAVERAKDKTQQLQARANAIEELAKLKSEIGQGEAPKELGGTEGGPAQTESQPAGEAETT